jgi:hypothetical protein
MLQMNFESGNYFALLHLHEKNPVLKIWKENERIKMFNVLI